MSSNKLNPAFDAGEFIRQNWQKQPVLLTSLVAGFNDPLSPEELAGLACEELVESRIVTQFNGEEYQLRNGPFAESDFTQLPDSNWTLLVQAVDQWVEEVADLKRLFEFIPNWRIDDVMTSFATAGGSVGPHYDYYDVFLLQGAGSRNWKVGARCDSNAALVPNSDLSLLADFQPTMDFDLHCGDALYIPPRFPHWGTASGDSLCYSIGFRAPSMAEMVEGFSDFLIRGQDPAQRYEDDEIPDGLRSGEIRASQLESNFRMLNEKFAEKEKFLAWFGCYATQPKYPELVQPLDKELDTTSFASLLAGGALLQKNPSSRFAFIDTASTDTVLLFVDGAMVSFPLEQSQNIASLCESPPSLATDQLTRDPAMLELLRRLLNQGSLLLSE